MKVATGSSGNEETHELLQGNTITVGSERFRCLDVLFQPGLVGKGAGGVHNASF